MKPLAPLLVYYIFQGPSYLALQKLDHFLARIQEIPDIHLPLQSVIPHDLPSKAIGSLAPSVQAGLNELLTAIFSSSPP